MDMLSSTYSWRKGNFSEFQSIVMREIKGSEQLLWIRDKGNDEAEKQSLDFKFLHNRK